MSNFVSRRQALLGTLAAGAAGCAAGPSGQVFTSAAAIAGGAFAHGVASGDPMTDRVILWTRVSANGGGDVKLRWEVAEDDGFARVVQSGEGVARASADWTFKADADELEPGKRYFYRFRAGDETSPVGRTKTLPEGRLDKAAFAVVSCSNFPFGYFNVYDHISRRDDLDAVLHLGDYIYEYSDQGYGGDEGRRLGRPHAPRHEAVTLADYRIRHAQYKGEAATQAMHAAHPMIAIWDDHEVANDSWKGGAENHQPATEGDWIARRNAAVQAYYEWMPIREPQPGRSAEAIFRSFSFGDLLTIAALETRLMARSELIEYAEYAPQLTTPESVERFRKEVLWDPKREILGAAQRAYIADVLKRSVDAGQPWRLIANQVIMANVTAPNLEPHLTEEDIAELEQLAPDIRARIKFSTFGLPLDLDAWDGYPAARERFYDLAKAAGARDLLVVTGDSHTWWANDLRDKAGESVGVELGASSITSPTPFGKDFLGGKGAAYALLIAKDNESVRYISGATHGYIAMTLTRDGGHADYVAVDTIEKPEYRAFREASFDIVRRGDTIALTRPRDLTFKERFLF